MSTYIVRFRDGRPDERVVADHHTVEGDDEATGEHMFANRSPDEQSHSHITTFVASYPRAWVLSVEVDEGGPTSATP